MVRLGIDLGSTKIESLRVLFPAPWGEKEISIVLVEYPAFERNEKVERSARGLAPGIFIALNENQ